MKETQVAIIGGGIVGTAVAHALARYKLDVSILEKAPAFGFGITKACMGGLHGGVSLYLSKIVKWWAGAGDLRSYLTASHHLKDSLSAPGRKMYLELAPQLNAGLANCGRLVVAETEDDLEKMTLMKTLIEEQGGSEITLLDRDGLKEMEPMIDPRFIGGIFDPEESSIVAAEWAIAFADCAAQNGVNTLLNTEVTGIEETNGSFVIRTNNDPIRAEYVINTAGVYSDDIAAMMGPID
ncbi:MAG: FAD-dependent oxidoreductase, partial [Deltaproteobacteria bacterium]|nr:FAD-dependent oxidoreductase [Deltaproteobacteria bacterium]